MDTLTAIRTRRSVGKSLGDVSRETIAELIEAATWAPNHKLTEPWHFTVVAGAARERLGEVWAREASADAAPDKRDAIFAGEAKKPLRSPALIVVSVRTDARTRSRRMKIWPQRRRPCRILLLAAHARGLSGAWKTGEMVSNPAVKQFPRGIEPTERVIAVVYLGAEAQETSAARDRSVASRITWLDEAVLTV